MKALKNLMAIFVIVLMGVLFLLFGDMVFENRANGAEVIPFDIIFGINNTFDEDEDGNLPEETSDLLKDLGVGLVSDSVRRMETAPNDFDWSSTDNKIKEYHDEAGRKVLLAINPKSTFRHGDGRQLNKAYVPDGPQSFAAYEDYVTKLVSRYGNKVAMVSVFNEPGGGYKDNIDDYVELIGRTYYIVKGINSRTQVVIGSVASGQTLDFHREVFKGLWTKYPEIVHDLWFSYNTYSWDWRHYDSRPVIRPNIDGKPNTECLVQFTKTHEDYVDLLLEAGWSEEEIKTRVINKEGATHTGEFLDKELAYWCYPNQTEFQQAEFLFKRAIIQAFNKVQMINQSTIGDRESYHGNSDSRFTTTGLIYFNGVKKLSYYTLKSLTRNLRNSDFDNVQAIETNIPNVRLHEFQKTNGPIYVLWWDYSAEGESGETKQVVIPLPNIISSKVKITEAIPDFAGNFQTEENRLKENDYPGFFPESNEDIAGSMVTIVLGKAPVYIEETADSSIAISNPKDWEVLVPGSKVTITAGPQNVDGLKSVYFYINNERKHGRINRETGQYYYHWKVPENFSQEYTIQAHGLDKKRNVLVQSDTISVFTSPLPSINLVISQDGVMAPRGKKENVTIQAQFSPDDVGITAVRFYLQDKTGKYRKIHTVHEPDSQGFYTWNWRLPKKPYGVYEIWARSYTRERGVTIDSGVIIFYPE